MKLVINTSNQSLNLSDEIFEQYLILKGVKNYTVKHGTFVNHFYDEYGNILERNFINRDDPYLIEAVEKVSSDELRIVNIPDNVKWEIHSDIGEFVRCKRGLESHYDVY